MANVEDEPRVGDAAGLAVAEPEEVVLEARLEPKVADLVREVGCCVGSRFRPGVWAGRLGAATIMAD